MSQFFTSGSQSTRASASASVLPKNNQDWFPLGLHGLISLQPKGLSRVFSKITVQKQQFYDAQLSEHLVQFSHPFMNTGKTIAFNRWIFVGEALFLVCNMLPRLVITFLPRSKRLLISWLQSPSAVILEPPKIKFVTVSIVSPSVYHEVMGLNAIIFIFLMLSFKPTFALSSFTYHFLVASSVYVRLLIFLLEILIPACASSSPAFDKIHSAFKRNKQDDNI